MDKAYALFFENARQNFREVKKLLKKKDKRKEEIERHEEDLAALLEKQHSPSAVLSLILECIRRSLSTSNVKVVQQTIKLLESMITNKYIDKVLLQQSLGQILSIIFVKVNINDEVLNFKICGMMVMLVREPTLEVTGSNLTAVYKVCMNVFISSISSSCQGIAEATLKEIFKDITAKLEDNYNILNKLRRQSVPEPEKTLTKTVSSRSISDTSERSKTETEPHQTEEDLVISSLVNFGCDLVAADADHGSDLTGAYCALAQQDQLTSAKLAGVIEAAALSGTRNEKLVEIGKFGWCGFCRKSAMFFEESVCLPFCSQECQRNLKYVYNLAEKNHVQPQNLKSDFIILVRNLSKINPSDKKNSFFDNINLKLREFCLIQLIRLLRSGSKYLKDDPELVQVIKETTIEIDSLVNNALSSNKRIYKLSMDLYMTIIDIFRTHLKHEIKIYLTKLVIPIMESKNFDYFYKVTILESLINLAQNKTFFLELFVNYDCEYGSKNVFGDLIDLVTRIINGMYSRSPYKHSFSSKEESMLRQQCLLFLNQVVRNFEIFADECAAKKLKEKMGGIEIGLQRNSSVQRSNSVIGSTSLKEKISKNLALKEINMKCVEKFNLAPKKMLEFAKKNKLHLDEDMFTALKEGKVVEEGELLYPITEEEAKQLTFDQYYVNWTAQFLKSNLNYIKRDNLSDFIASSKEYNKNVCEAVYNSYDLKGYHIIEAMKVIFTDIPLSGEGQIIDRMMQLFGTVYNKSNPGFFKIPDTAYYVAFSIILINTDLHREEVTNKMTLDTFIKNLRDLNPDEVDVPFLTDIYERIENDPLVLPGQQVVVRNKNKKEMMTKEKEMLERNILDEVKDKGEENEMFITELDLDNLMQLINNCWHTFLAIFSQLLTEYDQFEIVDSSITNVLIMGKICSIVGDDTISEAFLNTIIKKVNVMENKPIEDKNLMCIRGIVRFVEVNGNLIKANWEPLISILSGLDQYFLYYSDRREREGFFEDLKERANSPKAAEAALAIEAENINVIGSSLMDLEYENVFAFSGTFEKEGITAFISALCEVSKQELSRKYSPSRFCLHKLIEVAAFNINRIQIEWVLIWKHIFEHFVFVIRQHSNREEICLDSLDSLRQIVLKLLQKKDLSQFHFQVDFFKPFQMLMDQSEGSRAETVLTSIEFIINNSSSITSGYLAIFGILRSAMEKSQLKQHVAKIVASIGEEFENNQQATNNEEVLKGYIEVLCFMFVDNELRKFSYNSLRATLLRLLNKINTKESNALEKSRQLDILKCYFYGFDSLLNFSVGEHVSLLFDLLEEAKEEFFSSNLEAFAWVYFRYLKPQIIGALLSSLNTVGKTPSSPSQKRRSNSYVIEENVEHLLKGLNTSLDRLLDGNSELLSSNGKQDDTVKVIEHIYDTLEGDISMLTTKIEVFKASQPSFVEEYIERMFNGVNALFSKVQGINVKLFREDIICALLDNTTASQYFELAFRITGMQILAAEEPFSSYFWKILVSTTVETLNFLANLSKKSLEDRDSVKFVFSFSYLLKNEILAKHMESYIQAKKALKQEESLGIEFKKCSELLTVYLSADSGEYLDLISNLTLVKILIVEKSESKEGFYSEEMLENIGKIKEIMLKLETNKRANLVNILSKELNSFIPRFLEFMSEEQLNKLFNTAVDLLEVDSHEISLSVRFLLKEMASKGKIKVNY